MPDDLIRLPTVDSRPTRVRFDDAELQTEERPQVPGPSTPGLFVEDRFDVGRSLLSQQLSSPDSRLSIAIGNAEGNRTPSGKRTRSYFGHSDPANRRRNLGTFSFQTYQNPKVRTPQAADRAQLAILRGRIPLFEAACRKAGLNPNHPLLQAAFFDLSNQSSPRIWMRFLERMPQTLGGKVLTLKELVAARVNAMFDGGGRFTALGLKSAANALRDQWRRMRAISSVLGA